MWRLLGVDADAAAVREAGAGYNSMYTEYDRCKRLHDELKVS